MIAPLIFTALAFFTRMWKIGASNVVTWDEAQYGAFCIDVSPDILIMLTALANSDHII